MSDFWRSKPDLQDVINGHAVSKAARDALIIGTQSFWPYNEHLQPANSLIWRTHPDDKCVCSGSGSLLCSGSNADAHTKGLVFQNFAGQFSRTPWHNDDTGHQEQTGFAEAAMFKGGFFLPKEVQEGTIILDDQEETRRVFSGKVPELSSQMGVEGKENRCGLTIRGKEGKTAFRDIEMISYCCLRMYNMSPRSSYSVVSGTIQCEPWYCATQAQ